MSELCQLVVVDFGCTRGEEPVLRGINFTLSAGESLHLIGPNGCGKSTLLRGIVGLAPDTVGTITWQGPWPLQSRFLYLADKVAPKMQFTVKEVLTYWCDRSFGDKSLISVTMQEWGIASLSDIPASMLSHGQRQRLYLSQLSVINAPLWLLDEPFVGLDQSGQTQLIEKIHNHQKKGGSIIFANHQELPRNIAWQPSQCLDLSNTFKQQRACEDFC